MRRAAVLTLVLAFAATFAVGAQSRPQNWVTWDYPYECWPYQQNTYAYLNGTVYICEYVGPASTTYYAYVPQP